MTSETDAGISARGDEISEQFIATICKRLKMGKRVRRSLPDGGILHIDRQLPFLCVYRPPAKPANDPGTRNLVTGQASYLIAPENRKQQKAVTALVEGIAETLQQAFDAFLIIEVWAIEEGMKAEQSDPPEPVFQILEHKPVFQILAPKKTLLLSTIDEFQKALGAVIIQGSKAGVDIILGGRVSRPGFNPLLTAEAANRISCNFLGIAIRPIYRDPNNNSVFPMVLRNMRRRLTRACQRGIFDFVQKHSYHRPAHFHALGPRAMVKLVWQVDEKLAVVSAAYDFLLLSTPVNTAEAWSQFMRAKYQKSPKYVYRRIPFEPSMLKRQLYDIPIEEIDDPAIEDLYMRQQQELDRKLTMIQDRETPRFMYGSLQAYGRVDDRLLREAEKILEKLPRRSRETTPAGAVDANTFARFARDEIEYLRKTHPDLSCKVEVRNDIVGLMVSSGNLLIGADTKLPVSRVPALLAHELGTHMITYLNGRAQRFKQMYIGLPGYDELQEGLAVLAEYLVGGLSAPRIRLLAARVVGARMMIEGASFIEVFRDLNEKYGFAKRTSFSITTRLYRSGGLTKDAVYLRGLLSLLTYLKNGGRLEPLYAGKFALEFLPLIEELQFRHILGPAPFRPTYLDDPAAVKRLERVQKGLTVLELVQDN